ncbi:hypothetical protein HELRODRAFT_177647 [Helobdella robusta]|uniref:Uncharacterized protein n=1 Tax=Helobdella robusta TaxID=6412 RepID=T1FC03_HELRO|nr:hypothetical protein HELRODRAFT_177647 [Helobdella robusta]ESN97976.1 hypothetical protein HELRODRAFT_177647 [Helobdella robusta]
MASKRRSCKNKPDVFCYICGEYTLVHNRNQDKDWAPHMVCKACTVYLRQWTKGKKTCLKFGIPMVWREQRNHDTDCYFCSIDLTGINRKNRSSLDDEDQETEEEWPVVDDETPQLFSQQELNDLVRDLSLSKASAELHQEYLQFFSEVQDLVYCTDIAQLLHHLGVPQYKPEDWRLFIDSSKRSLKCVLLHNGNQFASVPLAHSTKLKEKYEAVKYMLEMIRYDQHKWVICVDLKMDWPVQEELVPCRASNVIISPLVDRDRILFPPLHIKLGLIKQFTKALDKEGGCFNYMCQTFPGVTIVKLKAGIFDGPQIRRLIRDPEFEKSMNKVEQEAWNAFVLVVKNFLGNNKARNYAELVNNMVTAFKKLGCNMSIKLHYLFSHMDRFPENLGSMSDEQGEKFHQEMKEMETRYQGRWNAVMMADYCWTLKSDIPDAEHSRVSNKRKLAPNQDKLVYNFAVRYGGKKECDHVMKKFKSPFIPPILREDMLKALAHSLNCTRVHRFAGNARRFLVAVAPIFTTEVKHHEIFAILQYSNSAPRGPEPRLHTNIHPSLHFGGVFPGREPPLYNRHSQGLKTRTGPKFD